MAASAQLRRLGAELRRLREAAGLTQVEVAEAVGRNHATVANWERGQTKLAKSDLAFLLAELRAPIELRKGLEQLRAEAARGGSHWATFGLPGWLRAVASFEDDAVALDTFEPLVIPGLLQTEDYARATHRAAAHLLVPDEAERRVAARLQRQQRLADPDPIRLHAVIGEAALRVQVVGPEEMAAQLRLLVQFAERDNVTVRVLPFTAGIQVGVASSFTLLHFADPTTDPSLAWHDGPLGGTILHDEGDVAALRVLFADLTHAALSEADSAAIIADTIRATTQKGSGHA